MLRNLRAWTSLVAAVIGAASLAGAQERQIGGVGLTVFTDYDFRGKSATLRQQEPDLARLGLNDVISSLKVAPGEQWEVCEQPNYRGRCVVVSGEEQRLAPGAWGNVISSARRVATGVVDLPSPTPSDWYVVLFDQPHYRGRPTNYRSERAVLGEYDNRAQSVTIGKGIWELCDGPSFTGRCVTLSKSTPNLADHGLLDRVSSVRPVDQPR